jgi:hypothetical protein
MTRDEAEAAKTAIIAGGVLPPGFPPLKDYAAITVRPKASDPNRAEVVGHRPVPWSGTRLVKTPGQPDVMETYTETRTVFDILAH